jgi:hypothetical protein
VRRMSAPMQFVLGWVLKAVLGRAGVRGGRRLPAGVPRRAPRMAGGAAERTAPSVRRRPLLLFMFGSLGLGLLLMLIFDNWVTRVVGVAALFAFIVSGVFLIADPAFLAEDDEG